VEAHELDSPTAEGPAQHDRAGAHRTRSGDGAQSASLRMLGKKRPSAGGRRAPGGLVAPARENAGGIESLQETVRPPTRAA